MARHYIRTLTATHRTNASNLHLGVVLAFVAGAINAGGFMAIHRYTSHMTGVLSELADYVALHQWHAAMVITGFLLAFVLGSTVCTLLIRFARARHFTSEFAYALLLEALLLLLFGLIAAVSLLKGFELTFNATIGLLSFIMGLQNAMVTKISHGEIRSTHVTGMFTDIGIELGKYIYEHVDPLSEQRFHGSRLWMNVYIIGSFFIGGVLGALAFQRFGFSSVIPLALLLLLMAAVPLIEDMSRRSALQQKT